MKRRGPQDFNKLNQFYRIDISSFMDESEFEESTIDEESKNIRVLIDQFTSYTEDYTKHSNCLASGQHNWNDDLLTYEPNLYIIKISVSRIN